jgi:hypothetical protein
MEVTLSDVTEPAHRCSRAWTGAPALLDSALSGRITCLVEQSVHSAAAKADSVRDRRPCWVWGSAPSVLERGDVLGAFELVSLKGTPRL